MISSLEHEVAAGRDRCVAVAHHGQDDDAAGTSQVQLLERLANRVPVLGERDVLDTGAGQGAPHSLRGDSGRAETPESLVP